MTDLTNAPTIPTDKAARHSRGEPAHLSAHPLHTRGRSVAECVCGIASKSYHRDHSHHIHRRRIDDSQHRTKRDTQDRRCGECLSGNYHVHGIYRDPTNDYGGLCPCSR